MIAYYVHHHGRGHLHRAQSIARAVGRPVTVLTSLPRPPRITPFVDWVELPRDDADSAARRHDADGALHWAPLDAPGYRDRMHALARWSSHADPAVVVVDVSVEVATFCRTLGLPVVVVAGAGHRHDAAHQLAYRLAERIIAPWPGELYRPAHLRPFEAKTTYVGAFSRYDDHPVADRVAASNVLLLLGAGGSTIATSDVARARRGTTTFTWHTPGHGSSAWSDDMWSLLCRSDVVVTHAGMNALAEVAAARRPAVVLPQPRPFAEQAVTAQVLHRHGLATVLSRWPEASRWPDLLRRTADVDGERWAAWNAGTGAERAAGVIRGLVDGRV